MKRKPILLGLCILLGLTVLGVGLAIVSCQKKAGTAKAPMAAKVIYHCPMHPNYFSDKPGTCPICGMNLVPVAPAGTEGQSSSDVSGSTPGGRGKVLYYRDAMNPSHTSDKPGKAPDGMDLVPVYEGEAASAGAVKIDPTVVQNIGVTTEVVTKRALTKEIRASATIDMNETANSIVNTKIMGWVEKLYIDYTGQQVRKGAPLLDLYSPDLVSTQEEFLQAVRYLNGLSAQTSPEARKGAEDLVESSKRRLANWDISPGEIDAMVQRGTPKKTLTIVAPVTGVVMEKMVVAGQNVMPGMALYKIADLSTVWAMAEVYQDDLPFVKTGARADITLQALPGRTFPGRISFISPVLDMTSKTASIRIEVRNTPDLQLKPQMFASAVIASPVRAEGVAVPSQAVIHTGTRDIVIVALGSGFFKPQEVKLGVSAGEYVQVLQGLGEGQTIVTSSQFLIDSESNLKAAVSQMSRPDSTSAQNAPVPAQPDPSNTSSMANMPGM
jgi:membrane fusion protein, copper/silver efflux system